MDQTDLAENRRDQRVSADFVYDVRFRIICFSGDPVIPLFYPMGHLPVRAEQLCVPGFAPMAAEGGFQPEGNAGNGGGKGKAGAPMEAGLLSDSVWGVPDEIPDLLPGILFAGFLEPV